jgi:hypothetical protein
VKQETGASKVPQCGTISNNTDAKRCHMARELNINPDEELLTEVVA